MYFYTPEYLKRAQASCREHGVLLILDETATGFGHTGKSFACKYADAVPDIVCLGKALAGGYLALFAAVTRKNIADTINNGVTGCFMHGPTLVADPLVCAVADESVRLLVEGDWCENVARIEARLRETLAPTCDIAAAKEMRVLGVIDMVEMWESVNLRRLQPKFVECGVWLRPFGRLACTTPPSIMQPHELGKLSDDLIAALKEEYGS